MSDRSGDIKVWDPLVRVFHWSLVAAFLIAYLSEDVMVVHAWAGYVVIGLLLFRLVWGFAGSRHARFSDFVRPPGEVLAYIKEMVVLRPKRYLGHNPAGGAMIIALLVGLILVSLTGLSAYGAEGGGPFAAWLSGFGELGEEALEEMHEFFVNFTLVLVVVHVAGVIVGSIFHGENLVRAMVTGIKQG